MLARRRPLPAASGGVDGDGVRRHAGELPVPALECAHTVHFSLGYVREAAAAAASGGAGAGGANNGNLRRLIGKGGKVVAISKGCDPSGLIARNLGDKTAKLVKADKVDIKSQVDKNRKPVVQKK